MGGKRTQQKIDELFAKQSACKKNMRRVFKNNTNNIDPMADIKERLGIPDEPVCSSVSVAGTKSLGFIKVKQTSLTLDEGGLGFKKPIDEPAKVESP